MLIRALPLVAGLLPFVGVMSAFWLNADAGVIPSCNPFFEGCTSVSSAGRYLPGSIPFRAALLPQAAFLTTLWWFSAEWLRKTAPATKSGSVVKIFGMGGALALMAYVAFLGSNQPFYEFMRRFGVYFYFLGTVIAQTTLTLALSRSRLRSAMLAIVSSMFGLGVLNLIQKSLLSETDKIENRIEWIVALLMQVWFIQLFQAWRRSKFDVNISATKL